MSRFTDRLARLGPGLGAKTPDAVEIPPEPEHRLLEHDIGHLRPWQLVETEYGPARVVRERLPRPACAECSEMHIYNGDPRLRGFRMDQAVYLDIEATGLSHGAGTFAFLIGLAWYEEDALIFEQLFVEDPSCEMAVLAHFQQLLVRWPFLVSFNGKSYDLSVLQSRLVICRLMSRVDAELKLHPHLDLLHTSRQAYKGAFADGRLQTLERELLHLDPATRADDIPGSLVPSYYFHFLKTGYAPYLDGILEHNRTDVLSLVTLTEHLLELHADPLGTCDDALVLYNLGRCALRRRLDIQAATLLAAALERATLDGELGLRARRELVTARRRAGDWAGAAEAAGQLLSHLDPTGDGEEHGRVRRQVERYRKKHARSTAG